MNIRKLACLFALVVATAQFATSALPTSAADAGDLPPGDDARVTRVVNADTIEVVIQGIGFTIGYLGVDAPNPATATTKAECFSREATAYNARLVAGQTVRVERDVSDFEPSGRLLRYVYLRDGRMVNEELLKGGFARAISNTPDRRYADRLNSAQQSAQAASLGLWKSCATKTAPQATATSPGAPCITFDFNEYFNRRGHRPVVLDKAPVGACVTLVSGSGYFNPATFTWQPAGTRIRLDHALVVRWADATVPVRLDRDGKLRIVVLEQRERWDWGIRFIDIVQVDRELARVGDRGQFLMLPDSHSFILEDAGNGEYVALVDVLQLEAIPQPDWPGMLMWTPQ